jgi:DNA-binding MarR family transcriptional regulator
MADLYRERSSSRTVSRTKPAARASTRAPALSKAGNREGDLNLALALMHFGFRKMIEEPDRLLSRRGFGRVHHRILFFVARRPGMSVGDLLSTLDVSKQSLHGPMLALVRAGLLAPRPDPANRRTKRLHLTRAGQRFEDELSGIQRKLFDRVLGRQGRAAEMGFRAVLHDLGEGRAAAVLGGAWNFEPAR